MDMTLGTWNVLSLNRPGALLQLINEIERYKLDILAIQETRWVDSVVSTFGKYTLMYSGRSDNKHEGGTGFIIHQRIAQNISDFKPINDRLCLVTIQLNKTKLTIICAYAPTDVSSDDEKEVFYSLLEETFTNIPQNHTKIVLGDFNAKIGKEPEYQCIVGKHSLHEVSSDNGLRLINFAATFNLNISSTSFPRKNIHKGTWKSNDGHTVNQIDHVIIDSRNKHSITDVKSKRGADCETDHFLVKIKIQHSIPKYRPTKNAKLSKLNTDALKNQELLTNFQNGILNNLNLTNNATNNIENLWSKIKETVTKTAELELGTIKPTRNGWFDNECKQAIENRMKYRTRALQLNTRRANEVYRLERKKVRKLLRLKKRNYLKNKIVEIENRMWANESRKAYKEISSIRSGYKPRSNW